MNKQKLILPISIIIASIILGGLFYLSQAQKTKYEYKKYKEDKSIDMMFKCREYGLDYFGDEVEKLGDIFMTRRYFYSSVLNTCLMEYSSENYKTKDYKRGIFNINTKETLVEYYNKCFDIYLEISVERASEECITLTKFFEELELLQQ